MAPTSSRDHAGTSRFVFRSGRSSVWLSQTPTISLSGQMLVQADAEFVGAFRGWLSAWFAGKRDTLDGEIVAHDFHLRPITRYAFQGATITSLGLPALDAGITSPGLWTLDMTAKKIGLNPASSGAPVAISHAKRAPWRCCDFRLMVGGQNTSRVRRIGPVAASTPGVFPDLNISVGAAGIKAFVDLYASGKPAQIDFLSCDLHTVLYTLAFTSKVVNIVLGGGGGTGQADSSLRIPVALMMMGASLLASPLHGA